MIFPKRKEFNSCGVHGDDSVLLNLNNTTALRMPQRTATSDYLQFGMEGIEFRLPRHPLDCNGNEMRGVGMMHA